VRILVLAPRLPHSRVLSGHRIVYQRLRRLIDRGHEIGLACFARPEERAAAVEWSGRLIELEMLPPPRRRPFPWWRGPAPFCDWSSPEMSRRVGDMVERTRYHVALAEFSVMGRFLHRNPSLPAVRRVISVHECETVAAGRNAELLGYTWAGLLERHRRDRLARMEFDIYRSADLTLVLTPQERYHLLRHAPDLHTVVVPSGVDTLHFRPAERPCPHDGIVFTGHFMHEQNRDAVRWFLAEVWPRVRKHRPDLLFYVIGPEPPPDIRDSSWRDPHIVVTGEVDDIRPYLYRSAVYVCPIRKGSGMRGRLLEAMACGVPVVATTAAVEGIPVQPGATCVLADAPDIMAEQIELLLDDEPRRRQLTQRAREMVRTRFSWNHTVDVLEDVLRDLIGRRTPRAVPTAAVPALQPG